MNRLLLLFSMFLTAGISCSASVILSVSPASQDVSLGSQVSFDVNISGLGNGTSLGTYDINLGFDPALLSYDSIVFGNQVDISGLGDIQTVNPSTGTVEVFELSLDSASELNALQASAFTLATLTFDTLAVGSDSPITLSVNALGDAYGNAITADIENGAVSVSSSASVPEPASARLVFSVLLAGLAGLAFRVFVCRIQRFHLGIYRFRAEAGCVKLRAGQPEDRAMQGCNLSAALEAGAGRGVETRPATFQS